MLAYDVYARGQRRAMVREKNMAFLFGPFHAAVACGPACFCQAAPESFEE